MLRVIGCITQQHDLRLVVLAACICALACGTTINLLVRARTTQAGLAWTWLVGAAAVFGCGVWSLHFVAMLAWNPGIVIAYAIPATIISAVIAIAGALLAFITWRFLPFRAAGIVLAGVFLGLAVSGMHYRGVAAMRVPGNLLFDHMMVWASLLVAIICPIIGFARFGATTSFPRRAEIAGWFALGICGLHFTAMTALSIEIGAPPAEPETVLASGSLAITVGSVSLAILIVSLAATLMEQHLSQRAIQELRQMRLLSDIAQEALIIVRDGYILQVNAACGRIFGVPGHKMTGRRLLEFIAEPDRGTVLRRMRETTPNGTSEEIEARTATGLLIPVELSRAEIVYEGKPTTVMVLRDLSDRKRDEEKIRHFAHHDTLTDLPNRFVLRERLTLGLAAAAASGTTLALFHVDLDRFKQVNDLLGHAAGDAVLVQVAQRLRGELRAIDTLARVGGDEFVILVATDDFEAVPVLAARLIDALTLPFDLGGRQVEIGASIGIALYPDDGDNQETLMHAADTALYRAKREKRGTFRFFESTMDEHLRDQRLLEQDLRHAIDRGELRLHYQPLVSCATGDVEGYEALIRWQHPERGMVPPTEFISLAEETGLILKIGQWVMETACRTAAGWAGPLWVAVNVSPIQFQQTDLLDTVVATLARTGLPAHRLEIEITEGVLMDGTMRSGEVLAALRELGVRIALDDFGTGYSSLSYLHSFRFDKLKIDKSFISQLGEGGDALTIVRTIVGLAHNLGLSVVAEGVETPRQLALIREYQCDLVQGFLFGRPLPMDLPTEMTAARARIVLFGNPKTAAVLETPDGRVSEGKRVY